MKRINKKGSFADLLYMAVFIFLCGIVFTVGFLIHDKINDEWQTKDQLGTRSKAIMQDSNDTFVASFDNVFLVIFIGLYLGALILAYNVDINPVFFFLSLFIMGVIVLITGVLGNAWYQFTQNSTLTGYIDDFTFIPFIMGNYVKIFVAMAFGLAGVMYAKVR